MSKIDYKNFIKQKSFLRMAFVVLFCVIYSLVLYFLRKEDLKNYHIYDGQVVGFTEVTVRESSLNTKGGVSNSYFYSRDIPIIKYKNKEGKYILYEEGHRVIFSSFEINEKIEVLENKQNQYKTMIFSFFYFWFHTYDLVFFIFLIMFFYIFLVMFL